MTTVMGLDRSQMFPISGRMSSQSDPKRPNTWVNCQGRGCITPRCWSLVARTIEGHHWKAVLSIVLFCFLILLLTYFFPLPRWNMGTLWFDLWELPFGPVPRFETSSRVTCRRRLASCRHLQECDQVLLSLPTLYTVFTVVIMLLGNILPWHKLYYL